MKYIAPLDGLRAIAALSVLAFHSNLQQVSGGFLGVDVFFVLSGYLMGAILLPKQADFKAADALFFIWRRVLRLWPLLAIVSTVAILLLVALGRTNGVEWLYATTFVATLTKTLLYDPIWLSHTWSISAEMQFYIIVAISILVLRNQSVRRFAVLMLGASIAITLFRYALVWQGSKVWAYFGFVTHGSGLFLGAFAATLPTISSKRAGSVAACSACVILFCIMSAEFGKPLSNTLMITLVELGTVGIILSCVAGQVTLVSRALQHPVLVRLGLWSYGIYLWHFPLARFLRDDYVSLVVLAIVAPVSIALAAFTYRFAEVPLRDAIKVGRLDPPILTAHCNRSHRAL